MGDLSFKTNHLAFTDITNKQIKTDSIAVFNYGATPMTLELKKRDLRRIIKSTVSYLTKLRFLCYMARF